jgi:hypothetical protein
MRAYASSARREGARCRLMGCLAAMARVMAAVGASGTSARVGEGCILLAEEVR